MKFETYPGRTKVPETINGEEALRTLFLSVGRLGLTKTNVLLSLLSQYESHTALWGAPSLRCQQPLASCEVAAPHQTNRVIQAPLGTCRTFWTPNQHDSASAAFRSLHPDYEIHPDALASLESEGMNNAQSAMEQPQVEVNNGWWAFRRAKYPIKAYSRDSEHVSDFASIRDPETLYICFRYTCSMILSTQHPSGTSSTLQDVREVHHVWNELFEFLGDRWRAIRSDFSRQHPEQWIYANSKIQEQIVEQLHPTCETMLDAHREVHESMFRFLVARIGLCSSVRGGMSGSRSPTVAHEGPKEYREFALPCNPEAQEYFEKFHTQNLEHIHDCFSSHLLVAHYRCLLQSPPAPTSIHEKMPDTRLSQTFALLLLLECGHAPYTSGAEWWADSARLLQRRRHFVYEAIRCGAHRCPVGASYLLYALRCVVALEASQWGLFLELVLKKAPNFIFTCASIPSIPFARIRLLRDLLVGRTPGGTQARVSGELQLREYVAARVQGEDEKGSVSKLSHLCQLFHFDSEITLRQFLSHFLGDTNDPLISKDHHALQCGFIKKLRCYKNSAVTAGLCSCAFLLDLESLLPQHSRCECVPVNNPTHLK